MNSLTPDEIIEQIGSFSYYQIRLLLIFGFMKTFGDGFQVMITTFIAAEPPWKCASNNSSPCSMNITGSISPGHESYKLRCNLSRNEWQFDTSEFSSIVSEWDLVCDRSSLIGLSKAAVFAGFLIGVFCGGMLSDKFGRKPIVYFLSVLCNVLALIASFVNSFWIFTLLRTLTGICIGSSSLSMFVLFIEYVGIRHRALCASLLFCFWTASLMLLSLWGYLIRDWRQLSIAASVPGLLQIFFWCLIPESHRWLMIKGKTSQATKNFCKVAKINRREMPENRIKFVEGKQRVGDVRDLFRTLKLARIILSTCFIWFVVTMIYYGVSFGAGSFGGNRYLVFFLVSIVEYPSNLFATYMANRFGRRKTLFACFAIASLTATGAVLLQRDNSKTGFLVGRIIMAMLAKFFINAAFTIVYVFTAELFPTVARNVAMGTASAVARIGSFIAPFIIWLIRIHILLPYSIFAAAAFIAGALCLSLPETSNVPIPDTFQEKEQKEKAISNDGAEKLLESPA